MRTILGRFVLSPPITMPKQSHITQLIPFVAQVPSAESVERATGGSGP